MGPNCTVECGNASRWSWEAEGKPGRGRANDSDSSDTRRSRSRSRTEKWGASSPTTVQEMVMRVRVAHHRHAWTRHRPTHIP
jgi:hypothetical protein